MGPRPVGPFRSVADPWRQREDLPATQGDQHTPGCRSCGKGLEPASPASFIDSRKYRHLGELRRGPLGRHPAWTRHAVLGGWNDLDSLNVGNGEMDGLTKAERQSYATLWAIAKSPLYTGDDLTRLDSYGLSLLTNKEVIAVNRGGAPPARPLTPSDDQQVWAAKNPDGGFTVALFNLGEAPASVSADWSALGFSGKAKVRDLWNRENLGVYKDKVTQALPAHGSRLFTVTPQGPALTKTAYEAEAGTNTLAEQRLCGRLRRLLRRQEGRQPLPRRQAHHERRHGREGGTVRRGHLLRQR